MISNINRNALVSLIAAILTVVFFCIGFAPIPMTAPFCYPASFIASLTALLSGIAALRAIPHSGENGRWLAWLGIFIGIFTTMAMLCAVAITILAAPVLYEWLLQNWQL